MTTFIRRNRVYLSGKTTLVVSADQTTYPDAGNEDRDNLRDDDDDTINVGSDSTRLATVPSLVMKINDENVVKEEVALPIVTEKFRDRAAVEVALPIVTEKLRDRPAAARARVFPPLLSSLNRNGRPRFSLEMVREAGRLRIVAVPSHFQEVVRTRSGGGDRLSISFVDDEYEGSSNSFDDKSVDSC